LIDSPQSPRDINELITIFDVILACQLSLVKYGFLKVAGMDGENIETNILEPGLIGFEGRFHHLRSARGDVGNLGCGISIRMQVS